MTESPCGICKQKRNCKLAKDCPKIWGWANWDELVKPFRALRDLRDGGKG